MADLFADIGGTNARFSLGSREGEERDVLVLQATDYPGPAEAVRTYLETIKPEAPPKRAAMAFACPVLGDTIAMTNNAWRFSVTELKESLGLERLELVNDFTAQALCIPRLTVEDRVKVGGGEAIPGHPIAVLGPGTGLGVALLLPGGKVVATEGGHVTMAATNKLEEEVLADLREEFGHVSAERVISGQGLVNLHGALSRIEGKTAEDLTPREVSAMALDGSDPVCAEALAMFFSMLGTVAGNLALTSGALGGVYIGGGIVPRLLEAFKASGFRKHFEAKGRFEAYNAAIPTHVITHPHPAFLGLANLLTP